MKLSNIRAIGAVVILIVWVTLTGFMWFAPATAESEAERRPLAQMPEISADSFMAEKEEERFNTLFEKFAQDQFPGRDRFRQFKSLFHNYILRQGDNNNIYVVDGYAAQMEYPMNENSVQLSMVALNKTYETLIKGKTDNVYMAVVPDKGYYLAEENGYLTLDYDVLFETVREEMPWAQHIDLTGSLQVEDYYRTDTHWRQEKILDAANALREGMGMPLADANDYTDQMLERPFYGVYYGQAALPMDPEPMYLMHSDVLDGCTTYRGEMDSKGKVVKTPLYESAYDMDKVEGKDMYQTYLSGSESFLQIENPNAATDKELIIFRDSFGSSMAPLLVENYRTVTIVDIRYVNLMVLRRMLPVKGQDVLFMYSTLVLNTSGGELTKATAN